MASCGQDAGWHAEGDVWTHTRMVCAELERLDEWSALELMDRIKLVFTALFHDSGKPVTTVLDPDTGRTRSPKHSIVGAELARRVLRELGCDLVTREQIVALVRYHGRPPYLLERPRPEHEVIFLSWLVDHRLLHLFALADSRGRRTAESPEAAQASLTRTEENLHLWKLVAIETGCYGRPYAFPSDHARFLFYRDRLSSLHYTPHDTTRSTVTLMSGLPGSGKDTWLAGQKPTLPVVSLDAIRTEMDVEATDEQGDVIQAAREQCRVHLRAARDFAFNATNLTRDMRSRWIDLFADYDARIEIVYLEPPMETVLKQNRKRPEPVPEKVIFRLAEKLEPPTWTEAHSVTWVDVVESSK